MRQPEEDGMPRLRRQTSKIKVVPLTTGYDSNGDPLATIESLPDELLLDIFELASSGWPSTRTAPLNVSSTCRRWRELALSKSDLWARLDDRGLEGCMQRINGRIASLWLERAGDFALLYISVAKLVGLPSHDIEYAAEMRAFVHAVTVTLRKVQPRLRVLALPRFWRHHYAESITLGKLPHLTELSLPIPIRVDIGESLLNGPFALAPLYDPLEGPIAPRLRIFKCSVGSEEINEERGLLNFLRHCPSLVNLALFCRSYTHPHHVLDDEDIDLPECILPSLKKLSAEGRLGHLLSRKIKAPNLEEVILVAGGDWELYTVPVDHISRLIRNSRAKPRRVVVLNATGKQMHRSSLDDECQTALFDSISEIKEVTLGFHAKPSTFELLSFDPDRGRCLPKLERLTLFIPASVDWIALQRMLTSRFNGSKAFRAKLSVKISRSPESQMSRPGFFKTFGQWEANERLQIDYVV